MRRRLTAIIGTMLTIAAMLTAWAPSSQATPGGQIDTTKRPSSAAPADVDIAAALWHCQVNGTQVCTRVTNAPSSGVQVLDRLTGRVFTLYNGNSVYLIGWYHDSWGLCGINGKPVVWQMAWKNSSGTHVAFIGSWYLTAGHDNNWASFPLAPGSSRTLHSLWVDYGVGRCDTFTAIRP